MSKKRFAFAAVALLVLLVACNEAKTASDKSEPGAAIRAARAGSSQNQGEPAPGSDQVVGAEPAAGTLETQPGSSTASKGSSATGQIAGLPIPELGTKVIKTANLSVRVKKDSFQENFTKASLVAEKLGGFVTSSSVSETKGKVASGVITLRVPSDKFQTALSELRSLGRVTAEEQSGEDVSREFVDLEARLRHAKSQEAFYLRLMDQAKTISDLIQIQQQLSQVQLQIEELTGRLEFLKNQTAFSTVSVRIFEPGVGPGKSKGALGKAWQEALDGFKSVVAGLIVALGWIAPIGLLALVLLGLWRVIRGRVASKPVGS